MAWLKDRASGRASEADAYDALHAGGRSELAGSE